MNSEVSEPQIFCQKSQSSRGPVGEMKFEQLQERYILYNNKIERQRMMGKVFALHCTTTDSGVPKVGGGLKSCPGHQSEGGAQKYCFSRGKGLQSLSASPQVLWLVSLA